MTKTYEKLAFQSSGRPAAKAAETALVKRYGNVAAEENDGNGGRRHSQRASL